MGVYHHVSPKHLPRYANELEGRYNAREPNTIEQMGNMVRNGVGKRLPYAELIAKTPEEPADIAARAADGNAEPLMVGESRPVHQFTTRVVPAVRTGLDDRIPH